MSFFDVQIAADDFCTALHVVICEGLAIVAADDVFSIFVIGLIKPQAVNYDSESMQPIYMKRIEAFDRLRRGG